MMNWRDFILGALIAAALFSLPGTLTPQLARAANAVVIYLTGNPGKGNQTFVVPSDWNSSSNTIECIGSGGSGNGSTQGGGGGAYAAISNLTLTGGGSATYAVGASATTTTITRANGTYFNGTSAAGSSLSCDPGRFGGVGGTTANSIGTTEFAGGNSGFSGGGAAGPHGAGAAGASGSGGTADNGFGGAGGESASICAGEEEECSPCSDGGTGFEYSRYPGPSVGAGGGGGQGRNSTYTEGCNGGTYGGGAGRKSSLGFSAGIGVQGVIIITYTPSTSGFTGVLSKFKIQGGRVLIRGGRVLFR